MIQRILRGLEILIVLFLLIFIAGYSNPSPADQIEKIRAYTRNGEFNYVTWMSNAAVIKLRSAAVNSPYILDRETQKEIVMEYLENIGHEVDYSRDGISGLALIAEHIRIKWRKRGRSATSSVTRSSR